MDYRTHLDVSTEALEQAIKSATLYASADDLLALAAKYREFLLAMPPQVPQSGTTNVVNTGN